MELAVQGLVFPSFDVGFDLFLLPSRGSDVGRFVRLCETYGLDDRILVLTWCPYVFRQIPFFAVENFLDVLEAPSSEVSWYIQAMYVCFREECAVHCQHLSGLSVELLHFCNCPLDAWAQLGGGQGGHVPPTFLGGGDIICFVPPTFLC